MAAASVSGAKGGRRQEHTLSSIIRDVDRDPTEDN